MGVTLRTYNPADWPLLRWAMTKLEPVDDLLDVGAGIRPQRVVKCRRHVCLDAHAEYCDALRAGGFETIEAEAPDGLTTIPDGSFDTVISLDVIEHMERDDGLKFVYEMTRIARRQIAVFTPLGFMPQHGGHERDPWGMNGQKWQEHRSGWIPEDFPGWQTRVAHEFHHKAYDGCAQQPNTCGAFFAILDK